MAQDLQSGFQNRFNVLVIRSSGAGLQVLTDRPIDVDNNGTKEQITIVNGTPLSNTTSGMKMKPPSEPDDTIVHYETEGIARSIIKKTVEPDHGVDISGQVYTLTDID